MTVDIEIGTTKTLCGCAVRHSAGRTGGRAQTSILGFDNLSGVAHW